MHAVPDRRAVGSDPGEWSGGSYPNDALGRKPVPARKMLEAVLWNLNTGAQWHKLTRCSPNYNRVVAAFGSGVRTR